MSFRTVFPFRGSINWFPGHMRKATNTMKSDYKHVNVVLEVRDARIPYSSSNHALLNSVLPSKSRLVLFNKSDLAPRGIRDAVRARMEDEGQQCLFVSSRKGGRGEGLKEILPRALDIAKRPFKTTPLTLLVVGLPNVGKSSLINDLRSLNRGGATGKGKGKVADTGPQPGVTRKVTTVKISERPVPTYLVDSPGVMVPSVENASVGLKMALCGSIKDTQIGVVTLADYLLFKLNQSGKHQYVDMLGLSQPTDDIDVLLATAALHLGLAEGHTAPTVVASRFLQLFRQGSFGPWCLDQVTGQVDDDVDWIRRRAKDSVEPAVSCAGTDGGVISSEPGIPCFAHKPKGG